MGHEFLELPHDRRIVNCTASLSRTMWGFWNRIVGD
jgi:hypothetical protein